MTAQTMRRGCAVLTAALATAVLAACTASRPARPPAGPGPRSGSAGRPLASRYQRATRHEAGESLVGHDRLVTCGRVSRLPPVPPAGSAEPIRPAHRRLRPDVGSAAQKRSTTAAAQVAQRCMSAAGFSYPVVSTPDDRCASHPVLRSPGRRPDQSRSGQVVRLSAASQRPRSCSRPSATSPPLPTFASEQRKHGTAWASALVGDGARHAAGYVAARLPAGGEHAGVRQSQRGPRARCGRRTSIFDATRLDRIRSARARVQRTWSACMVQHGLSYKSIVDLVAAGSGQTRRRRPRSRRGGGRALQPPGQPGEHLPHRGGRLPAGRDRPNRRTSSSAGRLRDLQQRAEQVLALPAADVLRFSQARVHQVIYLLIPRVHTAAMTGV